MIPTNPFDFINSIASSEKTNLIREAEDEAVAERVYAPFIINRHLSYFRDALTWTNELNKYNQVDKKLQYEFYLYMLRPANRRTKWAKVIQADDLDVIKKYYNYSNSKALVALSLLSKDQIASIRRQLDPGGIE